MTVAAEPEPVVRERVPVYAEHTLRRYDRKSKAFVTEKVTADRLQTIADLRNKKIAETGNDSLIIVGHTKPGLSEWEQAKRCPTVGYADNYEVGEHPKTGTPTLYARMKFKPTAKVGDESLTAEEVIDRFPRRSAELWLEENDLDAISVLGPTTPFLDLDLLRMARAADPDVAVAAPPVETAMNPECQQLIGDLIAFLESKMGGQKQAAAPGAPPPAAPAEAPAQYSRQAVDADRQRMASESDAIKSRRADERIQAIEAELAATKLQYQRTRREQDLIQLEAEGYDLDRAEELDRLAPLPDENYTAELGRMKKRYQRMPVGSVTRTADLPNGSESGPYAKSPHHDAAKEIMWANPGMSWEEAKRKASA